LKAQYERGREGEGKGRVEGLLEHWYFS
jgi:hypothetical protein